MELKLKLISLSHVWIPQGRCGADGRWLRRLRGTAGRVRLRWSSGSRVLWDPATDGSTARGPSAVSRSFSVLIDQTAECKFTDQSSSSAARWNFSTEMHSCSKKTFQVWWTLCLLCQVYISQFMTFFLKKKKKSQNVDAILLLFKITIFYLNIF